MNEILVKNHGEIPQVFLKVGQSVCCEVLPLSAVAKYFEGFWINWNRDGKVTGWAVETAYSDTPSKLTV